MYGWVGALACISSVDIRVDIRILLKASLHAVDEQAQVLLLMETCLLEFPLA